MSDPELDALVEETERHRIGTKWLAEIRAACEQVSRQFDPLVYAVAERMWSPSEIDELIQDVTTTQLLEQAQLEYMLDVAESIDDVRRLLRHQVRRALVGRRRRTVVDRLLTRLRDLLSGPGYETLESVSPPRYQPAGTAMDRSPPSDHLIRTAAARVRLLPVTSSSGDRAPTVFRSEVLAQALAMSFDATGTSLSLDDLARILREALTSWLPVVLGIGDQLDAWPADTVEPAIELEETVDALMDRLTRTEQVILRLKLTGVPDSALAAALGVSRPTAAKQKARVFSRLRELWMDLAGDLSYDQSTRLVQELVVRLHEGEAYQR